jgi:hypothetical protein
MGRLLAARGLPRPVRLILVEPDWQTERLPDRGLIARRTRSAAVVHRDPTAPGRLLLRYALFAADWSGGGGRSGRYGAVYLRDAGRPRPFVGRP